MKFTEHVRVRSSRVTNKTGDGGRIMKGKGPATLKIFLMRILFLRDRKSAHKSGGNREREGGPEAGSVLRAEKPTRDLIPGTMRS